MKPLSPAHAALLAKLDADQRTVAAWRPGSKHLKVQAGAGSGKSSSLSALAANLVADGIPASDIVVCTYSNRAGREIKDRIDGLFPPTIIDRPRIGTFHALALRDVAGKKGNPAWAFNRNVDAKGKDRAVPAKWLLIKAICGGEAIPGMGGKLSGLKIRPELKDLISRGISLLRACGWATPDAAGLLQTQDRLKLDLDDAKALLNAWDLYIEAKAANQAWDFDDLLEEYGKRLASGEASGAGVVLVDEAQDQTRVLLDIALLLAGIHINKPYANPGRIVLIGQSAQTIHRWMGAYPELFNQAQDVLQAEVVTLGSNYRSGAAIVGLGNAILQGVPALQDTLVAQPGRGNGAPPPGDVRTLRPDPTEQADLGPHTGFSDDVLAAQAVGREIIQRIAAGVTPSSIAILARTNAVLGSYQAVFQAMDIPCQHIGGESLFESREAFDFLSYCLLASTDSMPALERIVNVPRRYLGEAFLAKLRAQRESTILGALKAVQGGLPFSMAKGCEQLRKDIQGLRGLDWSAVPDAVYGLLTGPGMEAESDVTVEPAEDRPAIYSAMAGICKRFDSAIDVIAFADRALSLPKVDIREHRPDAGKVVLSSLHRAKGLEWDTVYLEASEGHLPHWRCLPKGDKPGAPWEGADLLDETRLFYVGCTRARDELVLVWSEQGRGKAKVGQLRGKSRFVKKFLG